MQNIHINFGHITVLNMYFRPEYEVSLNFLLFFWNFTSNFMISTKKHGKLRINIYRFPSNCMIFSNNIQMSSIVDHQPNDVSVF